MVPAPRSASHRRPPSPVRSAREGGPTDSRSGARRTAVLSLVMLLAGSGCAWIRGEPEPPPAPPPASAPAPSPEEEAPVVVPRDRTEEILAEGTAYLAIGDHSASRARFQYVLDRWEEEDGNGVAIPAELRARALWHLGLLHLLAEGQERDEEQALSLLTRLSEEYPATPEGVQARWLRTLLQDLEGARRRGAEQEQRIRELNETVEQLRRIDLNRRPAPPRTDTLQLTRED
jgi:hypothetical protein